MTPEDPAAVADPVGDLADQIWEPDDSFALLEALQPLLAPHLWTALCESLEVCPAHVCDLQICIDDSADCQKEAR